MLPENTRGEIARSRERMLAGKDTKEDRVLVRMADGLWHTGGDLSQVSWRFGAYLHNLKAKRGVKWEKERLPGKDCVYRYRLEHTDVDG